MEMSPLQMSMVESMLTILVKQIDNGSKQLIVMMMGHNSMNQHRKVGKKNNNMVVKLLMLRT